MAPATGNLPDSSANTRQTQNWQTNTIGQVKKNAGPPRAKPSGKKANTVVRIDTKEKPERECGVSADAAVQFLGVAEFVKRVGVLLGRDRRVEGRGHVTLLWLKPIPVMR